LTAFSERRLLTTQANHHGCAGHQPPARRRRLRSCSDLIAAAGGRRLRTPFLSRSGPEHRGCAAPHGLTGARKKQPVASIKRFASGRWRARILRSALARGPVQAPGSSASNIRGGRYDRPTGSCAARGLASSVNGPASRLENPRSRTINVIVERWRRSQPTSRLGKADCRDARLRRDGVEVARHRWRVQSPVRMTGFATGAKNPKSRADNSPSAAKSKRAPPRAGRTAVLRQTQTCAVSRSR